jgi:hypothetical protein
MAPILRLFVISEIARLFDQKRRPEPLNLSGNASAAGQELQGEIRASKEVVIICDISTS